MSDDYEFTRNGVRYGVFRTIGGGETVLPLAAESTFPAPSSVPEVGDTGRAAEEMLTYVARVEALTRSNSEAKKDTPEDEER